jgi:hypothetical protein
MKYNVWKPVFFLACLSSGCNVDDNVGPVHGGDSSKDLARRTYDEPKCPTDASHTNRTDDLPTTQCQDGSRASMGKTAHSTHQHAAGEPKCPTDASHTNRTDDLPATQCQDRNRTSMGKTAYSAHQHATTMSQEDFKKGCDVLCNENACGNGQPPKQHLRDKRRIYPNVSYCAPCTQADQ